MEYDVGVRLDTLLKNQQVMDAKLNQLLKSLPEAPKPEKDLDVDLVDEEPVPDVVEESSGPKTGRRGWK